MKIWEYEMGNKELVEAFMRACARAGTSNSGLVIDFMAGSDLAEAHYLRAVVHARLDNQKPPFSPGERVILKKDTRLPVFSCNTVRGRGYGKNTAPEGQVHEIWRVYYEGDGKWSLCFKDDDDFRYPAEAYEKTDRKADAPRLEHHYHEYEYGGFDGDAD